MKLRTVFIVTVLLFGVVLIAISALAIITNQMVAANSVQGNLAVRIAQGASELSYLANDYVIYQENQQLERWQTRFASFSSDVNGLKGDAVEQQLLVRNIQANTQRLEQIFNSVVSIIGVSARDQGIPLDQSLLRVSWSRIAVQSQALVSDASRLSQLSDNEAHALQQRSLTVTVILIIVLFSFFILNFMITQRRALRGLAKLQAGAAVVGSGNLDFKIEEKGTDEIADLSHAFNRMATDLKAVTASKTDLEREILRRSEVEEELRISNENLQEQTQKLEEEIDERKRAEQALRESEERLRSLTDNIPSVLMRYNRDLRVVDINKISEAITGIPVDRFIGKTNREVGMPENLVQIWEKALREVFQTGERRAIEFDFPSGGGVKTFFLTLAPEYSADGQVAHVLGVSSDVTERKKAEDDLKRYSIELEAANRELESFSYSVSHDLRAPLRSIDGFSGALLEDYGEKLDSGARNYLERIRKATQLMSQLIDGMLEMSRISRAEMNLEGVDLSAIASSIAEEMKLSHPGRKAEFNITPEIIVNGDKVLLQALLSNLLENAWKFTARGQQTLIEFGRTWKDDRPVYYVRDNGTGFDMKYADKLFKPFSRLHTQNEYPGTGIGLANVQRIVHRHGGIIWAESQEGKGTSFYFTLGN